jgi:tetratricopeptide (TPR) repeat protein
LKIIIMYAISDTSSQLNSDPAMGTKSLKLFQPRAPLSRPPLAPPISASCQPPNLEDPAPEHLNVVEENDLSHHFIPDFNLVSATNFSQESSSCCVSSLGGFLEEEQKSYDERECIPVGFFWRNKQKISSADVASVGNASDTVVSVDDHQLHLSGRDLHESAKMALNAGDFTKSLSMFEAILMAQAQRFGPCHPSVAAAMHNVGVCRQRMGQHDTAENLFAEAVQVRRQTLGSDHLEVAASLSKLGSTRVALQKFDLAFGDLRNASKIATKNLGHEHKTVAQIQSHLACLYFEGGELFAAQATFEDALEIYRAVWSSQESNRDTTMMQLTDTLCNIGSILNRRKRFGDAIHSFSEALDLQRGIFSHDHPRIVQTLDNLGYSYSKNKEYGRALTCYKTMLRMQFSHYGTFNNFCLETFRKEIIMYEKLKRLPEAVNETKETLKLEISVLPRDHTIVVQTKQLLEDLVKRCKRKSSP